MSALTPHIRVLRALGAKAAQAAEAGKPKAETYTTIPGQAAGFTAVLILASLADIFLEAADQLEAEERALEEKLRPDVRSE